MDNVLTGFIRENLIIEENKNDVIHFEYSEKAAKQFGYHTAILNDGTTINFTCQSTGKYSDDYKWADKVQFEPVKNTYISKWQYDNFLSLESKIQNIMRRRMLDEAMKREMMQDGSWSTPRY